MLKPCQLQKVPAITTNPELRDVVCPPSTLEAWQSMILPTLLEGDSEIKVCDKELMGVCKSVQEGFFIHSQTLCCVSQMSGILISVCSHPWKEDASARSLMTASENIHTLLFRPNQRADCYPDCTSTNPELPPLTSVRFVILGEICSQTII